MKTDKLTQLTSNITGKSIEEINKETDEAVAQAISKAENNKNIEKNSDWLIVAAQTEVKKKLLSPSSAKFSLLRDSYIIKDIDNGSYSVTLTVEHKNAYNVQIESTFVVELIGNGIDNYKLISIVRS